MDKQTPGMKKDSIKMDRERNAFVCIHCNKYEMIKLGPGKQTDKQREIFKQKHMMCNPITYLP